MKSPEDFHHEHPEVFRCFQRGIGRAEELSQYLSSSGLLRGTRSLLSIGPGEGDLEVELASDLECLGVIDPDGRALAILRERMKERGLEARLRVCLADGFQAVAGGIAERFDLVLASHSWYAIARDREALQQALALRAPGGTLAIGLASDEGMARPLKALGPRASTDPTAEAISSWAHAQGFPHAFELARNPKPSSLFLEEEGLTELGRALVGFLVSSPWEELSEAVRQEGLHIVRSHVRGDTIDLPTGWLVFR